MPVLRPNSTGHWEITSTKAKPFFWIAFFIVLTIWRGW